MSLEELLNLTDEKPTSSFTVYSHDGSAAIHMARYPGGIAVETQGELMLDNAQIKSLVCGWGWIWND